MKKIILLMLIIATNLFASEENKNYKSYILATDEGKIVSEENSRVLYPLASVTKMMTLMVVYDAIDSGEISKKDRVVMDSETAKVGGSKIWMGVGQKISVDDLIKATAVHSANNAAYALAKYVGKGSADSFVKRMRSKAKELGIENEVKFYTPSGLPSDMTGKKMDVGSAYGIYKISVEALENPKYNEYVNVASKKSVKIYSGKTRLLNRNKILGKEGIFGIKTGHHSEAGYNMAVASKKNNIELVYVILGGKNESIRDRKILNDIGKFYDENRRVFFLRKDNPVDNIILENATMKNLEIFPDESFTKIVGKNTRVEFIVKYDEIKLPLEKGNEIGKYILLLNGKIEKEGKLIIKEKILRKNSKFSEFSL